MRLLVLLAVVGTSGCSGDDGGPPPLATVDAKLGAMAVNDTSIFAIDTADGSVIELGLDGSMIGTLETSGAVTEIAAAGDLVAWVETEGNHQNVRRRKAGVTETQFAQAPHVVVTDEGVFYSDTGIIGAWIDTVPDRVGTPGAGAALIGMDTTYAYTLEAGMSVHRYDRRMGTMDTIVPESLGATVTAGQLAYRTAEGVRIHDVFTGFDALFGMPPAAYDCHLLLAGRAVMCGKYRCLESVTEEMLDDPVGGYAANGRDLYWAKTDSDKTTLYKTDAEAKLE